MRFKNLIFLLGILAPAILVFKNLFLPACAGRPCPLAWGDAPHFYPENFKELISEPLAWTNRGFSFGGISNSIFIWPLVFLYGLIGDFLGNDLTIRILFYFPSLILAGVGTFFLTRYLKLSPTARFFSVLTYLLSTYYILLIDGGQVGVALAYGLFPFTLLFLKKFFDSPVLKTFYLSLLFLLLLSIADPRVAVIGIITITLWQLLEFQFRSLAYLIPLVISWLGLNLYWIFPLLKNSTENLIVDGQLQIMRWYNPFLLFSPHWPANLFGNIVKPPIYFIGIPILIFLGSLLRKNLKYAVLFLLLSLLILGIVPFTKLPFGFAFRDSTKFFIPLVLFGGVLIGQSIDMVSRKLRKGLYYLLHITCYIYLLFLIAPALFGKMNFVLSSRQHSNEYQKIYENLKDDKDFFRTVWLPERQPLTYETYDKPAIEARDLASFWPFASINASEDVFNFLNNENFPELFKILGIKYLILSGNPREITKSESEEKDWDTIQGLVASSKQLAKVDWGTDVPIYRVSDTYPRFFAVKDLLAVTGPSLATSYKLPATLYFEDGKWDPRLLEDKNEDSLKLVFNGTSKTDLAASFLQKYFATGASASKNEWAYYPSGEYLKYKYELLIRGVKFTDFDYGKGISFSTQKNEKIEFKFKVPEAGEYVFLYRAMIPSKNQTNLVWGIVPLTLPRGNYIRTIENVYDMQVLNVVALVPKKEFETAQRLAETFIKHFGTATEADLKNSGFTPVAPTKLGTLKYKFEAPPDSFWIIMTDNYHPLWQLRKGIEYSDSVPVFSMVNGFYVEENWGNLGIEFKGQENVRWGLYLSGISILTLSIIYFWFSSKKKEV